MQFIVRMQKKNEGPLRSADDEFGLPRHIIDYIWKQKRILIMFEIEIFSAVARSLLAEITHVMVNTVKRLVAGGYCRNGIDFDDASH